MVDDNRFNNYMKVFYNIIIKNEQGVEDIFCMGKKNLFSESYRTEDKNEARRMFEEDKSGILKKFEFNKITTRLKIVDVRFAYDPVEIGSFGV